MGEARYRPKFGKDIRIKPDETVRRAAAPRRCARPECENEGTCRVPKARDRLNEYLWFCLEHARAHNKSWDYFAGMNETQIEAFRTEALTGHRPTWPLGKRSARARAGAGEVHFDDGFSVFSDVAEQERPRAPERHLTRPQLQALEMLGLEPSATLQEIKARYKELVKRFHPDANGGDRGAEERLKQVIKAYGVLRASRPYLGRLRDALLCARPTRPVFSNRIQFSMDTKPQGLDPALRARHEGRCAARFSASTRR